MNAMLRYVITLCMFVVPLRFCLYHKWQMHVVPNIMGRWLRSHFCYFKLHLVEILMFLIIYHDLQTINGIIKVVIMSKGSLCYTV